jgi:hypothetical protein
MNRSKMIKGLIGVAVFCWVLGFGEQKVAYAESEEWTVEPVPATISYQGRLLKDGVPVNGTLKQLKFQLLHKKDNTLEPVPVGAELEVEEGKDVKVTNGIFTAKIDISEALSYFDGRALWLKLVKGRFTPNGGTSEWIGPFPEQPLLPAPYALGLRPDAKVNYAIKAGDADTVDGKHASELGGTGAGDGHSLDAADGDPKDVVHVDKEGNVTFSGTVHREGDGKLLWNWSKMAFRAGSVYSNEWDDPNVGTNSTAMGASTKASGEYSTAMGKRTTASGYCSTAIGNQTTASGNFSTAMGAYTTANGEYSTAMGYKTEANGDSSTAMGRYSRALGYCSTAMGYDTIASGTYSTTMGYKTRADGECSIAMGSIIVSGDRSFGFNADPEHLWVVDDDNVFVIKGANVGIGVLSPSEKLEVVGTVNVFGTVKANKFVGDGSGLTRITPSSLDAADGSPENAVYVNNEGNVGIGTTNPEEKLTIRDGNLELQPSWPISDEPFSFNSPELRLASMFKSTGSPVKSTYIFQNIVTDPEAYKTRLGIFANANEVVSITSNRRIGIGTTEPLAKLSVHSSRATEEGLLVKGADGQRADLLQIRDAGGNRLVIVDKSGNVGLGTTNPQEKLTIRDGNLELEPPKPDVGESFNSPELRLRAEFNRGGTIMVHTHRLQNIVTDPTTHKTRLGIFTNANEVVSITSEQKVGIGSTEPLAKLHVDSEDAGVRAIYAESNGEIATIRVENTHGFEIPEAGGAKGLAGIFKGGLGVMNGPIFTGSVYSINFAIASLGEKVGNNDIASAGDLIAADDLIVGGDAHIDGHIYVVGGKKHAVVKTDNYGTRLTYADESTEVFFFDRGKGQLKNGQVTIELDPIFLETITVDEEHPLTVYVTPTSECKGLYVAQTTNSSFTVKELCNGKSNATFDWEVGGKRKGFENERLAEFKLESGGEKLAKLATK